MKIFFMILSPIFLFGEISQECIGSTMVKYFDISRKRPITLEIWYPVDTDCPCVETLPSIWHSVWTMPKEMKEANMATSDHPFPFIIISHGNFSDRRAHSWIAEYFVKKGFIVASIDHFGNTWYQSSSDFFLRLWDRPLDITHALDRLLTDPYFAPHIDPEKIGFIGYSLGGMTGIWLAGGRWVDIRNIPDFHTQYGDIPESIVKKMKEKMDIQESIQSFQDTRIKAMFLMAPAAGGFDERTLQQISIPILIVASKADKVLPIHLHSEILFHHIPYSKLVLFEGAIGHFIFFNQVTEYGEKMFQKWQIADDPPSIRQDIHEKSARLAGEFFEEIFK